MVTLQRKVLEKSDELENLPELLQDDVNLETQLHSKLNPNIFNQRSSTHEMESISSPSVTTTDTYEQITSAPITTSNTDVVMSTEPTISAPPTPTNENPMLNRESPIPTNENPMINRESRTDSNVNPRIDREPPTTSNENPRINREPPVPLTNNVNVYNSTTISEDHDEFEAGQTVNIQRQNPIIIAINNDRFVATVCCHKNQLLYNDYNQRNRTARLTLIPDVTQPTNKQIIDWAQPEAVVGGGDDEWIQDIAYSTKLGGYLLLNRSRLRVLHDDTHVINEFYQFPDRSMKRVTCNDTFIYLILASGITAQHGDEIIMMNYDKDEKICKTFRDVVLHRNTRLTGPLIGEISDLAVNNHGQVVFSYRLERRQEVGVCVYNVSNNGNDWSPVKQLLLNECWHNDLSYTPRIEWCEKLNVFMLVEYMTAHLIMLDQTGHVKGESRFAHAENRRDAPLNLSISTNDWLCVRYESSINIHRIEDDRL
jgi:hypothetical protein